MQPNLFVQSFGSVSLGDISLTEVKPKLNLGRALTEGSLEARMEGRLHASIVDGTSGASIWSGGWRARNGAAASWRCAT